LILITGSHIRAARGLLGWTQKDLAKRGKVALGTLRKMEESEGHVGARTETLIRVTLALQKAGVEFLDDEQPGVRLKKK
jgi:transcriptional regulator with XRE-family HTH domain